MQAKLKSHFSALCM